VTHADLPADEPDGHAARAIGSHDLAASVIVAEEAAFAYKDIEAVMAASASLVKPVRRLTPLGVVKG